MNVALFLHIVISTILKPEWAWNPIFKNRSAKTNNLHPPFCLQKISHCSHNLMTYAYNTSETLNLHLLFNYSK
jgi:hypothetical protein